MSKSDTVCLACPAKVNLALAVGAADPDRDGMHPIASWMLAVEARGFSTAKSVDDS